ncbi:hypothetical protein L1887_58298 [Cichorium endivia]|nr:hypothetical protein L1887_58298 [Cichorium endivia]
MLVKRVHSARLESWSRTLSVPLDLNAINQANEIWTFEEDLARSLRYERTSGYAELVHRSERHFGQETERLILVSFQESGLEMLVLLRGGKGLASGSGSRRTKNFQRAAVAGASFS